eukprot:jgi/Tetstr1/429839/TSEL_019706.t1
MASSPGSGESDTTLTLPTCSCRSGYSCDCDARASDRKEPEKRKYTWGKGSDEVAESDNGKVSSLISKRTSRDCIRLMLAKEASEQSPCCSRKCVHKLYTQCGEALVDAVLDRALTVYSGNQNRSFDRLAQVLRGGYESASDKFDYMFDHGGYLRSFDHRGPIYTCGRAWEALHQVSKHIRLVIQRSVVDNEPTYIRQRKQYESRQTGPREHVRMFLEHFFSDDLGHVEIMPFHDGNSETFKKHLPPWMTKICVYYYYKSWAEDDNAILRDLATESEVKLASFDTFRRTWKEDFPDVTTPKVKRFSHCPICAAGKALRDQAREICTKDMTPEERQVHRQHQQLVRRQVRAEQKVHLERVRQERRDLNNAVFQSRLGHGNFFFFEIDSMDSAKTLLPHWVRIPKTVKPDMLLKYHLTCVKYDGYRPDDIYYYTNTIPHDSSTTCTLIWITIMKEIQHRGRKIPYIRIQMDNTVRENKNRNVAALCNWLVSIGICDVIHLVFLPVGHTHERVDQIFSRISLALSRSSAYTIEAFLDLVAKAFSPTPEIAELSFSLDFSEWLRPHFQDHIQDISKPHKFEFTRDDDAASGGSLRTALWSNTPLSEPVQILKSAPTGTPEIRAGRPLLYALCDKKKPDAVKVQRYLDDFKKVRSYITDLAVQWHFSPVERESWKNLLDDLDEMQTAPSAAFSGFWPQRKEEVDDFLREHGQTVPAEARHTMATNADLNNAEAARVEAEVRAQVLQDDSAFRGVHAGAKERLHDNTSPSDAKGSNLVVIDVSDTKGGKKPVDTSWEKCLTLPWKLVEAVPLSYAKAIHDASGSREVFNEDGTMVRKKCPQKPAAGALSASPSPTLPTQAPVPAAPAKPLSWAERMRASAQGVSGAPAAASVPASASASTPTSTSQPAAAMATTVTAAGSEPAAPAEAIAAAPPSSLPAEAPPDAGEGGTDSEAGAGSPGAPRGCSPAVTIPAAPRPPLDGLSDEEGAALAWLVGGGGAPCPVLPGSGSSSSSGGGISFSPRGLVNNGNTCFMNTALQALMACPPFGALMAGLGAALPGLGGPGTATPTLAALGRLARELGPPLPHDAPPLPRHGGALNPGPLMEAVVAAFCPPGAPQPRGGGRHGEEPDQHDAQEFLTFLLDAAHQELLLLRRRHADDTTALLGRSPGGGGDEEEWEQVGKGNRSAVTRGQASAQG